MSASTSRAAPLALLLAGAVLISFSAVLVRLAHVGPVTAAFWRMTIGGLSLACWAWPAGGFTAHRRAGLGRLALAGLLFAAELTCWHTSILAVGPGLATLLANFQVFVLAAWGALVLGERPGARLYLATPLALVGLWMLVGGAEGGIARHGVLIGLLAALFYGGYLIVLRGAQTGRGMPALAANMALISLTTALALVPAALLSGQGLAIPDGRALASLLTYGVVCQALGWMLVSGAMPRLAASVGGLALLFQPLLSFVWDVLLFSRPTSGVEYAGLVLALCALWLGMTRRAGG